MVLPNDRVAVNRDVSGISADEDPAAPSLCASVAGDYASAKLSPDRLLEIDSGSFTIGSVQSVVRDAASPHAELDSLTPDAAAPGASGCIDCIRLDRAARDFNLAVDQIEASTAGTSSSTVNDIPRH